MLSGKGASRLQPPKGAAKWPAMMWPIITGGFSFYPCFCFYIYTLFIYFLKFLVKLYKVLIFIRPRKRGVFFRLEPTIQAGGLLESSSEKKKKSLLESEIPSKRGLTCLNESQIVRASESARARAVLDRSLRNRKTKIKTCYIFRLDRANYRQDEDICYS